MRTFTVRLPSIYDGNTALPLVVAMHGGFGSGTQLESQSLLSEKAEAEGFIVVYPDGVPSNIGIRTWNAGGCCGYAMNNDIDDVGYITALLDTLLAQYAIDDQRVYATGMSNGGFMSYRLACELSERIAAIAPVSASMTIDLCQPARPIPVLGMHSYLDTSVPWQGGVGDGISGHYNSPQDSVQTAFALHASCAVLHDTVLDDTQMTVVRWHQCDCEQEMLLYMTHDGGHSWPGGTPSTGFADPPSQVINANDLMWDFFQQYTLGCVETSVAPNVTTPEAVIVFPQPTAGPITISGKDLVRIEILDGTGRTVHREPSIATDRIAFDLSHLAPGGYLLYTMDAEGVRTAQRIIRQL